MKRTIKVECDGEIEIDDILAEVFEKVKGGYDCNWSYAQQANKRKEVGLAKSTLEASRQIAEETGESVEAVRHKIRNGEKIGEARQEPQPAEIITSETEKTESTQQCECVYDKEVEDLCSQLRRRIKILRKDSWNWGMRNFVLDQVQALAKQAAKK